MKQLCIYIVSMLFVCILCSCERQQLENPLLNGAIIPVRVDWTFSGISPEGAQSNDENQNYVHKVAFRFFPKDGGAPFEVYLEGQKKGHSSIYGGNIQIPVGEYAVKVMNETVLEENVYWADYFSFSNIDNFEKISAHKLSQTFDFTTVPYDFYKPQPGETFCRPAHKLATWSTGYLSVTPKKHYNAKSATDNDTLIVGMTAVVQTIQFVIPVENAPSVKSMRGVLNGLLTSRNLVTKAAGENYSSVLFELDGKFKRGEFVTTPMLHIKEHELRTFGRYINSNDDMRYQFHLDVILVDGTRYKGQPMVFDITDDLKNGDGNIHILIKLPILKLPKVEGAPSVGDWENEEDIPIG